MRNWLRKWWPVGKALLAVLILAAVGRQFARDLQRPDLWQRPLRFDWMVVAGALYLLGLGCSAFYWHRLLHMLGQRPDMPTTLRAYFLGHLGKYIPGKAWALVLRAGMARAGGVRLGVAAQTSLYEVLTTMTAGALLAALLLPFLLPETHPTTRLPLLRQLLGLEPPQPTEVDRTGILLLSLGLLVGVGIPILPAIFNRLIHRLTRRFQDPEAGPLPQIRLTALGLGLLLTAGGWLLLGASLWAACQAVLGRPVPLTWDTWGRFTAFLALAYVAGFAILLVPSGLGVREFFLTLFLVPEVGRWVGPDAAEAKAVAVLIVLLLRLIWTAAEVIICSIVYWLPRPWPGTRSQESGVRGQGSGVRNQESGVSSQGSGLSAPRLATTDLPPAPSDP